MTLETNNIVFQQRDKYSGTQVNNINQFKDLISYPLIFIFTSQTPIEQPSMIKYTYF